MAADSPERHELPGPASSVILDQTFDGGSLYALRSAVGAHAAAGLDPLRIYDVVTTAHELAANAVRHGAGHGRLRLHADGPLLYCQVSDDGPPAKDGKPRPVASGTPPWPRPHGHGLWLIAQVADWLSIDHGPAGTTATARFTISPVPARDEATAAEDNSRPTAPGEEAGNPAR